MVNKIAGRFQYPTVWCSLSTKVELTIRAGFLLLHSRFLNFYFIFDAQGARGELK